MEMTTPVFTRTGDATSSSSSGSSSVYSSSQRGTSSSSSGSTVRFSDPNSSRMQFMLEKRFAGAQDGLTGRPCSLLSRGSSIRI